MLSNNEFNKLLRTVHGKALEDELRKHRVNENQAVIGDVVFHNGRYEQVLSVRTIETYESSSFETIAQVVETTGGSYNRNLVIDKRKGES